MFDTFPVQISERQFDSFCNPPGVSIVLCYTFQLTVFLPCLALNARRSLAFFAAFF